MARLRVCVPPKYNRKCNVIVTQKQNCLSDFLKVASNGGGLGSVSASSQQPHVNKSPFGDPPSKLTASSDSNQKSQKEVNFQTVHAAFGREIEQDLQEHRRLKQLAQKSLIEF